jgi:Clip-domain serine protease homolog masquerade/Trypsin
VTAAPDPREECPGSCIVSLLSFTCFRNAEMTDLFKCKKSGTQCCAPKTKIQEQLDKHNRNNTYPYNPNLGPINPNYPHPQQYYNTNYPPPPQNSYPQPPPASNYPPNNYPPPPPHIYENTIPPQSSISYEIVEPTTSPRPPPYSKYVCGVKGTIRTAKEYLVLEGNSTSRRKRSDEFEQEVAHVYKSKNTERLVLGSSLVPIPIVYDDNSTFSIDLPHDTRSVSSHRQARVVGGEDGENGEWCWQVALINSQNQYLCGGALIGESQEIYKRRVHVIEM